MGESAAGAEGKRARGKGGGENHKKKGRPGKVPVTQGEIEAVWHDVTGTPYCILKSSELVLKGISFSKSPCSLLILSPLMSLA